MSETILELSELCPYCKKEISHFNSTNKDWHLKSCQVKNPLNPLKCSFTQKKLSFSKLPRINSTLTNKSDAEISAGNQVETIQPSADGTSSQSVEPCSTLTGENSQFSDAEISAGDLATTVQLPVDGTSSQPMAGDHEPIDLIPSLLCQSYDPKIEKFYENFPFQLFPTIPHIVLCGSSLHHKSNLHQIPQTP